MGVDGQEEPPGGGADGGVGEPDGLPPRQVPGQSGPPPPTHRPKHAARSGPGGEPGVPSQRSAQEGGSAAVQRPPSDRELIGRMRAGDDSAYAELYHRHAKAVWRYARSCCRDPHTADDLTGEVFARTLQAVRGGAGPDTAVRAYLLTTVRRVAAAWGRTTKREQLVEDFAAFASAAERVTSPDEKTTELSAEVRAMREAEQSLAVRAFRSLPERWQTVLWHTTVEEVSPSEVAHLLGLTANATAVLAHRAREGLKQAYLQAHVSTALTAGGACARYADRLGAYARGGLRTRAERGLRKHLEECARCRLAAREVKDVNERLRALLPVAVVGWFAAGYSLKAAGAVAGAAGAAGAAVGGGAAAAGKAGGAASSEGLGAPTKAAIAAGMLAATAGIVYGLASSDTPRQSERPRAQPSAPPLVPPTSSPAPPTTGPPLRPPVRPLPPPPPTAAPAAPAAPAT
ncbi:sigma-70 family RNA polymerase sigma factor, partial [Streptomyces sp. URMC 123]|uniref:sigma-70 family RNA polymerase sigma factor n=1 Tax=Streptomyces sp. URMC 123 TaxID=3423403 RepID=UPI003F1A17FD